MDELTPEQPEQSKAIITAAEYQQEIHRRSALPPLSKENMAKAEKLARELIRNEDHLDDIVTFGSDVQAAMANISKEMLVGVRLGTLDEIVRLSDDVLAQVHSVDVAELVPQARPVLIVLRETAGMIKRRIEEFFRRFQLVNAYLDRQEAEIFAKETASTERFNRHKMLTKASLQTLLDAQIKATAINIFLDGECGRVEAQRRLAAVSREKETALAEGRAMDYLMTASADRYGKYIERLEAKRAGLQKVMLTAYQMNIASRMMGENENTIRQKLSDVRTELLPQWRAMIGIAYEAYKQQGLVKFIQRLNAAEAQLRDATGRQLERTSEEIAALMTSEVIDVEAMRQYHERLTRSLDNLKTASIESKKIRERAEGDMQQLIAEVSAAAAAVAQKKE